MAEIHATVQGRSRQQLDEANCPHKYYDEGGIIYGVHGLSSINYVEVLRTRLAAMTKAANRMQFFKDDAIEYSKARLEFDAAKQSIQPSRPPKGCR